MTKKWLIAALFNGVLSTTSFFATAQSDKEVNAYVSDDLIIYMHTGPGRQYRIIGSIEAGSAVTTQSQNQETGFTQIVDETGREGWVETEWLHETVSRKVLLPQVQGQLEQANATIEQLENTNARLAAELAELKQQHQQVNQTLDEQQKTVTSLEAQVSKQSETEQRAWFIRGGILVAASIFLGMLLTYMPKKRRRSDGWM